MTRRTFFNDESGQIIRKIVVAGVIFGVIILVIVEVGPLIWERFSVAQTAEDIANAAANHYFAYHDQPQAIQEVADKLKLAGFSDDEIRQATVEFKPSGGQQVLSIKVTVVKYADTLITKHINALKKFAKISASKEMSVLQQSK